MAKEASKESESKKAEPKKVEPKKVDEVLMSTTQYFDQFHSEVHPYSRAFVYPKYYGILKSRNEWNKILEGII